MRLTFEQAVKLPTYYQVTYRLGNSKRIPVYFDNKEEADAYGYGLPPEYRIVPLCSKRCSTCNMCDQ